MNSNSQFGKKLVISGDKLPAKEDRCCQIHFASRCQVIYLFAFIHFTGFYQIELQEEHLEKLSNWLTRIQEMLFRGWVWRSLLFPFICTRLIWLLVGLIAMSFAPNPTYTEFAQRGWFLSPHWLIDIWTRWDSKWYLSIVEQGYSAPLNLSETISNIAFFPLYPYLVKMFTWIIPNAWVSRSLNLFVGLLVSNGAFLAGGWLLYRLTEHLFDERTAHRALQLIFVFPTSFVFSAFYTESLFLFLAVAVFILLERKRWLLAGLGAGLLSLTRPQGVLICLPMLLFYLESIQWKIRAVRFNIVSLLIPVAALAGHLISLLPVTGSLVAPVLAQKAWGKLDSGYLETIWTQIGAPMLDVFKLDFFFLLLFLVSAVWLFFRFPSKAYGLFAFLMVFLPITAGSVISVSRYVLAAFPVFMFWAERLKNENWFNAVRAGLFAFQVIFFLGWANYYWIA